MRCTYKLLISIIFNVFFLLLFVFFSILFLNYVIKPSVQSFYPGESDITGKFIETMVPLVENNSSVESYGYSDLNFNIYIRDKYSNSDLIEIIEDSFSVLRSYNDDIKRNVIINFKGKNKESNQIVLINTQPLTKINKTKE